MAKEKMPALGVLSVRIPPNKLHIIARQMPHTSLGFIAPLRLVLSGLSLPSLILYLIE